MPMSLQKSPLSCGFPDRQSWMRNIQRERREIEAIAPNLLSLFGLVDPERLVARGPYPAHEILRILKSTVLDLGLTPSAWRYLCRLPVSHALILFGRDRVELGELIRRINFLAEVNKRHVSNPVFIALLWLAGRTAACEKPLREHALRLARAAARYSLGRSDSWHIDVISGMFLWFERYVLDGAAFRNFDHNQQRASFSWYCQQACNCGLLPPGADLWPSKWESLVGPFKYYGFDVVPLVTSGDLQEEGDIQWHCAGIYGLRCAQGHSRLFSIRLVGQVHATIELVRKDDDWHLAQIRDFHNTPAGPVERMIAYEVLRRYQGAWRRQHGKPFRSDSS